MGKLTTVILARPNSGKLESCLESVLKIKTKITVLIGGDVNGSKSEIIAKKHGAKILKRKFDKDFAKHRNYALKHVESDWVFFIDDDEVVSNKLAEEIKLIVNAKKGKYSAYAIPRENIIFSKKFKHGGQYPDYVIRLFRRKNLKKFIGSLHEQPSYSGKLKHLDSPLIHYKHESLYEMVQKTNDWSKIEARLMFEANHPEMNIARFISAMFREFWLRMMVQKAFMDGQSGVIYALYQVFSRFMSYAKLWEIQINENNKSVKGVQF